MPATLTPARVHRRPGGPQPRSCKTRPERPAAQGRPTPCRPGSAACLVRTRLPPHPRLELGALRAGDTLVVWRLDRLGRSLPDLVQIVADLEQRGVQFESLTEKIETGSAAGKLQFHVFAALAEFERGLIRERTRAGLEAARARGRSGGRKPKLDAKQIRHIKALLRDPNTCVAELARDYGVSRTTIYKHCGVVQPRHD